MKHSDKLELASQIKKNLRLSFRNKKLLESALFHPSYLNENPCPGLKDFDRLEFFGDAILNYVVCQELFRLFPEAKEGLLSRLRSILVSRKILARVTKEIPLIPFIHLGKSLRSQPVFTKTKVFSDVFESFLAALYFDRGFEAAKKFILKHFRSYFDIRRLFRLDPNPKSTLQELSQKEWQKLPVYVHHMTPKGIQTTVMIGKMRKASAVARRRQDSEEKAARLLIQKIRQELVRRSKKASSGKKLRRPF